MALVEIDNLGKTFDVSQPWLQRVLSGTPRALLRAVDDVSLRIEKGQTLALVGESGCGKSTLARLVVGLYDPSAGAVCFDGQDWNAPASAAQMRARKRRVQMIFQDPYASLNPRWRVADVIAEPIRTHRLAKSEAAVRDRVSELLKQVKLSPQDAMKFPHQFSGGQRQRISIARALAAEPEFLVCDEPTSALDVSVQAQVLNLMRDLQRDFGLTYLFISHNLAVVHYIADQIGVMYLGRLVELADTESLFARPQHPYTKLLLEAIPDLEMRGRERAPIAGEVPSPINPPSGCTFHPRCPLANERCQREVPLLRDAPVGASGTHRVACHALDAKPV